MAIIGDNNTETAETLAPPAPAEGVGPAPRSPGREQEIHYQEDYGNLSRRNLLKWLIRVSYGAYALAGALPALAIKTLQTVRQEIAAGDDLVYAAASPSSGANAGDPLKAGDLQVGQSVQVFPKGKTDNQQNLIQIVRVAPGGGAEGLVAYSAICTHLGCAVYAKLNEQGLIACPCHGSRFDPKNKAAVSGGPAPRPLPPLPIEVKSDGTITAKGPVEGKIGAD